MECILTMVPWFDFISFFLAWCHRKHSWSGSTLQPRPDPSHKSCNQITESWRLLFLVWWLKSVTGSNLWPKKRRISSSLIKSSPKKNRWKASDLCPREHELGTFGLPKLWVFCDGRLCGTSDAQPSFPRPRWLPFVANVAHFHGLEVKLLESDPLQPRNRYFHDVLYQNNLFGIANSRNEWYAWTKFWTIFEVPFAMSLTHLARRGGDPFCYGSINLSDTELQPVTYRTVVVSKALESAPGRCFKTPQKFKSDGWNVLDDGWNPQNGAGKKNIPARDPKQCVRGGLCAVKSNFDT